MKKPIYHPYGIKDQAGFLKGLALFIWGGIAASLFLNFFLYQLLSANRAASWLCQIAFYLSDGVSTVSLFCTLALLVLTYAHEEKALRKKLLVSETLALFSLSFVLRLLLYYLSALIDTGDFLGFYLNDVTLSYLTEAGGFRFFMSALTAFLGILTVLLVVFLSAAFLKKRYQGARERGKAEKGMLQIPTLVYLAVSVTFALIDTVMTVIDKGFAFEFSVIFTLVLPYLEIAIYTLIGHFVIDEVVRYYEKKQK